MSASRLDALIHDVRSKCASLKEASDLLRRSREGEARELISLMAEEARTLARRLEEFKKPSP